MHRTSKFVEEAQLGKLVSRYISDLEIFRHLPDNSLAWDRMMGSGYSLADAVLGSKVVPEGQAKTFELVIRLFMTAKRAPKDLAKWTDINNSKLDYLTVAATKWPERTETGPQTLKVGPFSIHNVMGLTGEPLKTTLEVVADAERLIQQHLTMIPGFNKVLYGNIYIVGQLIGRTKLAWYKEAEDAVYLRPHLKIGNGELHNLVHEFAHRYWAKFIPQEIRKGFLAHSTKLNYQSGETPPLPKPGEPIGITMAGYKGPGTSPIVKGILGDKIYLEEGGYVTIMGWIKFHHENQRRERFPTLYSATDPEEHFCEVVALLATGKLTGEHLEAFEQILGRGTMKTSAMNVTIDGVKYTWKREPVLKGRMSIGSAPSQFRPWRLISSDGQRLIAQITHTLGIKSFEAAKEPPAWKVMIRVPTHPEEQMTHGTTKNIFLKGSFPSPQGDTENIQPAMELAVKGYMQFIKGREHLVGKTASELEKEYFGEE